MPKSKRIKISGSQECYKNILNIWNKDLLELQEQFYLILLNHGNEIIGYSCISKGGISATVVDIRILFAIALKCCACSVILAHNHPSGGLIPSRNDKQLTSKIKEAGKLLDISLLDHLIITKDGYYSFADEGNL